MTWTIEAVGIYNKRTGELRTVKLGGPGLHVLTGTQSTGKTAILRIVEYCLLATWCKVPRETIREHCSHVGILLSRGGDKLALVRPLPEGRGVSNELYLARGPDIALPDVAPDTDWHYDQAMEELLDFTQVEALPILRNYGSNEFEDRYTASSLHFMGYLLQYQTMIANPEILFPGLESSWEKTHVIDAAYYFFGVVSIETLRTRRRIRELTLQRNKLVRDLEEMDRLRLGGHSRARELWRQAQQVSLVQREPPPDELIQEELRAISTQTVPEYSDSDASNLSRLEKTEHQLSQQVKLLRARLAELDYIQGEAKRHQESVDIQVGRLSARELLPPSRSPSECRVCGSETSRADDLDEKMSRALQTLRGGAEPARRMASRAGRIQDILRRELDELGPQLARAQADLSGERSSLVQGHQEMSILARRQRLLGRIEEYLDAMDSDPSQEWTKLEELRNEIEGLEAQVDQAAFDRAMAEVENAISQRITALTQQLPLEQNLRGRAVRLSLRKMSLQVWDPIAGVWGGLAEVGSGANHICYHIATAVAIHEYGIAHNLPIPYVVMLDQPSQAWFPADEATDERGLPVADVDREAVRKIYSVLREAALRTPKLQIVVSDHARPDAEWFASVKIEDWRRGTGLVPRDWIR